MRNDDNKERKGKWQPFDGLEGYKKSIRSVVTEREKKPKPVLLPDELEILNEKLNAAITQNAEITVSYYQGGYIRSVFGKITKVDAVNKEIAVGPEKIKISMITKIDDESM